MHLRREDEREPAAAAEELQLCEATSGLQTPKMGWKLTLNAEIMSLARFVTSGRMPGSIEVKSKEAGR